MPSRKAPKRKVKEVVVPKGTEGEQLSVAERKAKLESFIEQFDLEGKATKLLGSIILNSSDDE